jgi:hypothetical protein
MGRVIRYRGTSPSLFFIVVHHRKQSESVSLEHNSGNITTNNHNKKSSGVKGVARSLCGRRAYKSITAHLFFSIRSTNEK